MIDREDWTYELDMGLIEAWKIDQVSDFPLTLVIADQDEYCVPEYALELMETMSSNVVGFYNVTDIDHVFFKNETHPVIVDMLAAEVAADSF